MAGTKQLGALLSERRDEILARWRDGVRDDPEVPAARRLSEPALIDHLPRLIDDIVACLADPDASEETRLACGRTMGASSAAFAHAAMRHAAGYSIRQALRELTHFRDVVLRVCAEQGADLHAPDMRVFHGAVDEGITIVAVEMAAREVRWREEILGVVSHDLRNPLAVILTAGARLETLPEARKYSAMIERSGQRMRRLIDDLSDLGAIRAGKLALERQRVEIDGLLVDAVDAQQTLADGRSVLLAIDERAGVTVSCDPGRILQVFANLMANAIGVLPPGGHVWIGARASGGEVVLHVRDDGPGIRPDERDRLFDRYWRGADTPYQGTGLGLTIAQGILAVHGGRIWVESERGHGTTFWFALPVGD